MANFHLVGMPSNMMFAGLGLPLVPTDNTYKAVIIPEKQKSVVGSVIKFDARNSFNPTGAPLNYFWAFKEYPIGSQVERYQFTSYEVDDSIVSFSPDVPGFYTVELIVGDNNAISEPAYAEALIYILMVPHNQGLVPDASFIWNYLGDFWDIFSDRDRYTTIWSSMIQILSNELLSAYQTDYNKSIRDIQDYFQKKWLSYSPRLDFEDTDCSFILAEDTAGTAAATSLIGVATQPDFANIITILKVNGSFTTTSFNKAVSKGRIIKLRDAAYTMLRSIDVSTSSAFLAEENTIRTGMSNLPWRFSATMIHKTLDFEKEGVNPGDLLAVRVNRDGTSMYLDLKLQIVSVNKRRLGFVFNLNDLVEGVAATGLTVDDQVALAKAFKVEGLTLALDGSPIYLDEAQKVHDTVTSLSFKRSYYETELQSSSKINVGTFSVTAQPLYIVRNSKVPVDIRVASVPTLQEYVKQPGLVRGGSTVFKAVDGKLYPLEREPYFLFENIDYIIDNDSAIASTANILAGNNVMVLPYADLVDRRVQENDTLVIETGLNANVYRIIEVLDQERLRVDPTPQANETLRACRILRRIPGNYIRFIKNLYNPKNPNVHKFWAEVTYIDNSPTIENNFGVLVEFSKERKDKQGIKAPYKAAIAGLMYAFSRGPTIYNMKLGAHILLGLPFTYHRGVIVEINPEYRLDDQLAPYLGRVLIEERDTRNKPTGVVDAYFYLRGKQLKVAGKWEDQDPDFSGLAINKDTGKPFAEGDFVERFTLLSKGVEISDYLSDPVWYADVILKSAPEANIKKYHTAYLRANIDLYGTADFDFVGSYVRKAKPHYIDMKALALKSFADEVKVEDDLFFKPIYTFYESVGLSLPNAAKFDGYYITPEYMTYDGLMYTRYIYGDDLVTTFNSNIVTSQAAGFVTARTLELHDTPYIRAGDLLVITSNLNVGKYPITTVTNDTTLVVNNPGKFQTIASQDFTIYRPIKNPVFTGTIVVTQGSGNVVFGAGIKSSGAAVGDLVVFDNVGSPSRKYTITSIAGPAGTVAPPVIEPNGLYDCMVGRDGLMLKHIMADDENEVPFLATTVAGANIVFFQVNVSPIKGGFIKQYDTLYLGGLHPPYTVLDWDESTFSAIVTPTPSINSGGNPTQVYRTYRPSKFMSVDVGDRLIQDPIDLELRDQVGLASYVNGNPIVVLVGADQPTFLNIKPGDLLKNLQNGSPNASRDIGYGPGCIPILDVQALQVILTRNPIATDNAAPYAYIRRRGSITDGIT